MEIHIPKTHFTSTFHFTTVFFLDFRNKENQTVLEYYEQIIEDEDVNRGYIAKETLFEYFEETMSLNNIKLEDINENSVICEYTWSELDNLSEELSITKKIIVK